MVSHVLKRNGSRQAFNAGKLKRAVERAAKDAKLGMAKRKELLKEVVDPLANLVKKKRLVRASALRKALLGRLERRAKSAAAAWRSFDRKHKK